MGRQLRGLVVFGVLDVGAFQVRFADRRSEISLAVFAFNLFGDSLRDWLDPKIKI